MRSISSYKLEKLSDHLKSNVKKAAEDTNCPTLNDYCSDVMSSLKNSSVETDTNKEDYRNSKEEYDKIVKEIRDTDEMQKKLMQTNFLGSIEIPEKELDLVSNKIWKEEVVFQAQQNKRIDKNGDKRLETKEEKEKLLAALRAIDKGEDSEYDDNCEKRNGKVERSSRKDTLMNVLFGDDIEN